MVCIKVKWGSGRGGAEVSIRFLYPPFSGQKSASKIFFSQKSAFTIDNLNLHDNLYNDVITEVFNLNVGGLCSHLWKKNSILNNLKSLHPTKIIGKSQHFNFFKPQSQLFGEYNGPLFCYILLDVKVKGLIKFQGRC